MNSFTNQFYANRELFNILDKATIEEKLQLTRILEDDNKPPYKVNTPFSADQLTRKITWSGGNTIANIFRGNGNSYLDMLDDVARLLKIPKNKYTAYSEINPIDDSYMYDDVVINTLCKEIICPELNLPTTELRAAKKVYQNNKSKYQKYKDGIELRFKQFTSKHTKELEEKIIYKFMEMTYEKMNDQEKLEFDKAIQALAVEKGIDSKKISSGVAGLIVIGELGGFTTYMLMSMALSKLGLGALGFGVFTGASSFLSIILGPVGWGAAGGYLLWSFAAPNKQKVSKLVLTIALIRMRLLEEKII
ncbi:hypothetical protein VXO74_10195 [Acinetobacter junii]|uniref:hypothetical protein n=1 Tax=Acinetobacter junii TaxID=40215 RepID=UPI003A847BF0